MYTVSSTRHQFGSPNLVPVISNKIQLFYNMFSLILTHFHINYCGSKQYTASILSKMDCRLLDLQSGDMKGDDFTGR